MTYLFDVQWPVFITVFLNVLYKTLVLKWEKNKCLFVAVLGGQTWDLAHELSTLPKCVCMIYVCSVYVWVGVKSYMPVSFECSCVCTCTHVQIRGQPWVLVFHVHLIWNGSFLLLTAVPTRLEGLQASRDSPASISWQAGITDVCSCIQLYMSDGDLNFHSHVCIANTLSTEPFPQPKVAAPPHFVRNK